MHVYIPPRARARTVAANTPCRAVDKITMQRGILGALRSDNSIRIRASPLPQRARVRASIMSS